MYSLAKTSPNTQRPQIDYNVYWKTTFTKFAAECIERGQWHTILRHVAAFGRVGNTDEAVPSWVPDWSRSKGREFPHWGQEEHSHRIGEIRYDGDKELSLEWHHREYPLVSHVFQAPNSDWDWKGLLDWSCLCIEAVPSDIECALIGALLLAGAAFIDSKEFDINSGLNEVNAYLVQAVKDLGGEALTRRRRTISSELMTALSPRHLELLLRVAKHLVQNNSLFICSEKVGFDNCFAVGICTDAVKPGDSFMQNGRYLRRNPSYSALAFIIRPIKENSDVDISSPDRDKVLGISKVNTDDTPRVQGRYHLVGASVSYQAETTQIHWPRSNSTSNWDALRQTRPLAQSSKALPPRTGLEVKEESNSTSSTSSSFHRARRIRYVIC